MIQTSESSVIYVGNNSTTVPYPVPFYFQNDADLLVVFQTPTSSVPEYIAVLGSDYTVTGKGNPSGGSIKTVLPLNNTARISIARQVPMTQLTSYEEGDSFPAKSHEAALDKLTMEVQQLARGTGTGDGSSTDIGTAFRVTQASGGIKSLIKVADSMVGIDSQGEAILRTPADLLSWLGQVGTVWTNATTRATTRGAFAGQTGVQLDNWAIYVARSTAPGDWVPHLKESGVVISTNGVPTAKPNPAGDIVGTDAVQTMSNKTLNNPQINNPTGMTGADVGLGNCDNTADASKPVSADQALALASKQDLALKGQPNGYPDLDATGKVPTSQLPGGGGGGGTIYKGTWNASTNSPSITTGSANAGNLGWFYIVGTAGTTPVDTISSWAVGDQIVSNGTVWQKVVAAGSGVTSVNARTNVVVLSSADVGLANVNNTSDVSKNSAVGTLTNKTIDGAANTLNVRLNTSDVSGNLPVSRLNGGSNAGPNTWWCGDQSWKQPPGTGDTTGVASNVDGEMTVFTGTDGKHIKPYAGAAGFLIANPGGAPFATPKIAAGDLDPNLIHNLIEKVAPVDNDEFLIWDSVTSTFMKVKKKNLGIPAGSIVAYAGLTAPTGWLLCAAQSLLRATYPELFAAIGVTWGAADGTHFSLPDLRGMITMGPDNMGGTDTNRNAHLGVNRNQIGQYIGAPTHTLDINQIPQHQHILGVHTVGAEGGGSYGLVNGGPFTGRVTVNSGYNELWTDPRGGSGAHNNVQYTWPMNQIIKY